MRLSVDLTEQCLTVWDGPHARKSYAVSTGANGVGEINGSGCTPRGRHIIRAKIGAGLPAGTVLTRRRVASDVSLYTPEAHALCPRRDWILSRILWLSGTEIGSNRLGCVDTMRRFIYIHGTPDSTVLAVPGSKGCIRMRNTDVIELFDLVALRTEIELHE